ncbi:hypothetical protein MMC07_007886 [Pseudocyphellaria aurata]|nr:hypothetical protein [Pseudocyphellaria aurata]
MKFLNLNTRRGSAEKNREELLLSLRKKLKERRSVPNHSDRFFVTAHVVGEVLTTDAMRVIFAGFTWRVDGHLDIIRKYLKQVLATLITIKWTRWSDFKSIFLTHKDPFNRPVLGDHRLPFSDLEFLEEDFREEFERNQHIFRPILIEENSHKIYPSQSRLPFLKLEIAGEGGFGTVHRVLVERNTILYTSAVYKGDFNHEAKNMARKVIEIDEKGKKSFLTESYNLEKFKQSLSKNENIMMSFATFEHGAQFNIISPLADLDLHKFLFGEYGDFLERSNGFTPHFLFQETWCLAFALKFLHEGLALPSGLVSCAHYDLKPENILVEWSTTAGSTAPGSPSDMPVGRWKLTDFGISVVNPRDPVEGQSGLAASQHLTPGDIIRERSMKPPRDPGPFQAPEMRKHKGLRVSTSSDMWSFGCVVSMILAFALGGPEKVWELHRCRDGEGAYSDDYFYTDTPKGSIVKPEIGAWLDNQKELNIFEKHREWINKCQELIHDLLSIDKYDRLERLRTHDAGKRLLKIGALIENLPKEDQKRLWTLIKSQHGLDESQEPNTTVLYEDTSKALALKMPPASARYSPQGDQSPLQLLNTPEPSSFVRLETPAGVTQTTLSTCGRRVAHCSASVTYVYLLDQLHQQTDKWTSQGDARRVEKESFQHLFQCFHCYKTRQWTSVLLAGNFIALASTSRQYNDYTTTVDLYDRPDLGDLHVDYVDPMHQVSVPENCLEVKLSSNGVLLLQFLDRLVLSSSRGRSSMPLTGRLVAASFSHDGKWLFGWETENNKYCWFIWDMSTARMKDHGAYSRNILNGQSGVLRELLIPATQSPQFVVCDQYGSTSIIRGGSSTPRQAWDIQFHQIVTALTSNDNGVVFIRQPHSVRSGQKIDVVFSKGDSGLVEGPRPFGELDKAIDPRKCGIAIYVDASHSYLLTCYPDGFIARKALMNRASRFSSPSRTPI